ncbi:amidohydrolase [Luteolibacter flavescens]|uniref:Amidohydrolase n=1 Tax=Luteolibacter flavescens TaxID=1859460 RepID=A0ABT3FUJ5_9BACT|nr:amidohydrolase [Luteolibacter flavescens]MCW1887251.1 amidohydrolase [Luteolibacter flavescens]
MNIPDLILKNGRVTTLDPAKPEAKHVAIKDGRILATSDEEIQPGPQTKVIDLQGHRVIPGLNDSHLHLIRGGLNYNLELRWDGIPSLAEAMRMLKIQAAATPTGQWVRVVGSWSEFQFVEQRMPTLDELNAAAPDTPVFILHLYCRALLNQAALRACGYTKDTPNPPGGEIQRDKHGNPTGLLIARPNAMILYATLAKGPKLPPEHQLNSTRHFMRELNRLGVTSCIDAGGGFQNYPEDYEIIRHLHDREQLTVRIAYNLFTQKPKEEKDDFARWMKMTKPGDGDAFFRMNGAGEMLVFSAADFEDFLEPRPDLAPSLEEELEVVVTSLASNRWPFRLHATYDESISRFLDVFERVNREVPLHDLRWFLDHCETISDRNLERVKALGGGIAIQHRMAFQGEYFVDRYGAKAAERTPPVRRMLEMGIPVGAGTDATRVANYNPFNSLYWLVSGRTVGGLELYPEENRMAREEALRLYTAGSAWFSGEDDVKGRIIPGQHADLVVTSDDYMSVAEEEIRDLQSVLTLVGGKPVYAAGPFREHDAPAIPVLPEWSPVATLGGYGAPHWDGRTLSPKSGPRSAPAPGPLWGSGCDCFAF